MAVHSLFLLSVKVVFDSTALIQSTCTVLPPTLLQYLLYRAVRLKKASWIEGLVRYWPMKILSFDFDKYIDDTLVDGGGCEQYLWRHCLWYFSASFPQMVLQRCITDSIAAGLYLRVYVDHIISELIVDLSMVSLEKGIVYK